VPVQGVKANLRSFTCRLDVGEDEDAFKVQASFLGFPEYQERSRYMRLDPGAQNKLLKERLEGQDKHCLLARTEVQNAVDPRQNVSWRAEGRRVREPGRRLSVEPFPLVPSALWAPEVWPERRVEPIILPHLGIFAAKANFRLPPGCRLLPHEVFQHRNAFGMVVWVQELVKRAEGPEVQVVMRVDVEKAFGAPDQYEELKDFLAWVREAETRMVVLERS